MNKHLETYNLPRMNHEDIENRNRPTTSKVIESEIKNLLTKKSPGPLSFIAEFYQTVKEVIPPFTNSSKTYKRREHF